LKNNPVVLIAFWEQDNLGIGYIASLLLENGFNVKIIDFRSGREEILYQIQEYNPIIVGFSIIFQYHIYEFRELINFLRQNGINCHFTAGGHYPSLRSEELFNIIPSLDSIVLFEGEHTFLELTNKIYNKQNWHKIKGITYKTQNTLYTNPLRPLEKNIDIFPPPVRQPLREYALGKRYATILASRGCLYNCSFCSIRAFYSKPEGPLKRIRQPDVVVREMELLHKQRDGSIFMFQDDDFPSMSKKEKNWVKDFCNLLIKKGLNKKIMWKINCRTDEIDSEQLKLMKSAGLFLVYLGIEDGTEKGLNLMNKHIEPEVNIKAVNILKKLDIEYDFGFMLFNPESTFSSVRENLTFLRKVCGDGSSPTEIESVLQQQQRLTGSTGFRNYNFRDPSLDDFYSFLTDAFNEWISSHDGILNTARWARYYLSVYKKYYKITSEFIQIKKLVKSYVTESNNFILNVIEKIADIFNTEHDFTLSQKGELQSILDEINVKHNKYESLLSGLISDIEQLVISEYSISSK